MSAVKLRTELVELLAHERADVRYCAICLLPAGEWRRLPTVVIENAVGESWDTDDIAKFLAHPLGGARLLVRLRDDSFCRENGDDILDGLPAALAKRAPLSCLRMHRDSRGIADSSHPTSTLEAELLRTEDYAWQEKLLAALSLRGCRRLRQPPPSDREELFDELLRARAGERDAALLLRRRLWADETGYTELRFDPTFVANSFVRDWTPREYREWGEHFEDDGETPLMHRYSDAWRVRLIESLNQQNGVCLTDLPLVLPLGLRVALWSLALRDAGWIDEVVEVLVRRREDSTWLRDQIAALEDARLRERLRVSMIEQAPDDEVVDAEPPKSKRYRFGLPR